MSVKFYDANGSLMNSGVSLDDTVGGTNALITKAPTSNALYNTAALYVLKSLFDAYTILMATTDNTPVAITISEQQVIGRLTGGAIKGLSIAELQTLIHSLAFPENVVIVLTAAPSADGKYSGIVETGTSGETTSFGSLLYFKAADSKWWKSKADVAATCSGKIGISLTAAAAGAVTVLVYGKVRADGVLPSLTIGAPVYVDYSTAGLVVTTLPAKSTNRTVRIVGYGNTAHELFFCPDNLYLEYA